MSVDRSAYEE
jgi:hypothetical protein